MKIARGIFCSIHHSYFCCGREGFRPKPHPRSRPRYAPPKQSSKWTQIRAGVWKQIDPNHPRGFRIRISNARMAELLNQKIVEQEGLCAICGKPLTDLRDISPDHIAPSSMGGAWRDDHESNIAAAHRQCNCEKGSRRIA